MKITLIGAGYVGLVSGACLSEFGHIVTCFDIDEAKINALNQNTLPLYEPGLAEMVRKNKAGERLFFSTSLNTALQDTEVVMIAVGTPTDPRHDHQGEADLTYVFQALDLIAPHLSDNVVLVTKSTVPVGTTRRLGHKLKRLRPELVFSLASNPEFLREGSAIGDFMRPDRVVVGHDDLYAKEVMQKIYRPLFLIETPLIFTTLESSELSKYAANAFLAMKISYINEMADLCEKTDADVHEIAKIIGLDGRIGSKFLHPSPGFGGSCFPKDLRATLAMADEKQVDLRILKAVYEVNESRKITMAKRIIAAMGDLKHKKLAILGLTFKPNTDDMREAPSLTIIPALQEAGAVIQAYDPKGHREAEKIMKNVIYCDSAYGAAAGAEALIVLTEWNEFRALDLKQLKTKLVTPLLFDFRNIFNPEEAHELGFTYQSLGRHDPCHSTPQHSAPMISEVSSVKP